MSGPLLITGHAGLAGSALVRAAAAEWTVITVPRTELDLRNAEAVSDYVESRRPAAIIHAAARNAGIAMHEAQPADMLADNLAISLNVINASAAARVPRLLYISSASIYSGEGPHTESSSAFVFGGATAGYAMAKVAGMMLCEAIRKQHGLCFHSIIPCNLYGAGDNFHPQHATVLPGMMRRMHDAILGDEDVFHVWGSGRQTREFLHADDLAAACLMLLSVPDPPPRVNCGTGPGPQLLELAEMLKAVTGFPGRIVTDASRLDGAPRAPLDSILLRSLGWAPRITLEEGLRSTWNAFREAYLAGTLRGG